MYHTTDAGLAPSVCFKIWALKHFTDHTQSGITTEDLGHGTGSEDVSKILSCSATAPVEHAAQITQNFADAPLAAAYTDWPYSTSYQHDPIGDLVRDCQSRRGCRASSFSMFYDTFCCMIVYLRLMQSQNHVTPATEDHTLAPDTAQFAEVHPHIATTQIAYSCLPVATTPCQWTSEDSSKRCSAQIACKNVPHTSEIPTVSGN
jgi:hypothetical protein